MERKTEERNQVIKVQNVYYMLAYAFKVLNEQGYKKVATEDFENTADLLAAILIRGIGIQIKRGLKKDYIPQIEHLSSLRGKIDVTASIKEQTLHRRQMVCSYDVFSSNAYMNLILKTTAHILLRADVAKERKKALRKLMVYFIEVEYLDVKTINWHLRYDRNNQTYRMLIAVCYLVVKGLLQMQSDGNIKLMDFLDESRMHSLYERFIREYYRREFPQINVRAAQIPWQLDDDMRDMLPTMQTDIMLEAAGKTLIVDAKYYAHATQSQYGVRSQHSGNLYQIFTYVKNKAAMKENPQNVSGLLLYAGTDEDITPNQTYSMSGNRISVETLDLNQDFSGIKAHLDRIVMDYFGIERTGM